MNWNKIYNRLFQAINSGGEAYYSGPRFIKLARQTAEDLLQYGQYIEERRDKDLSTSREVFFYDILMSLDEGKRIKVVRDILDTIEHVDPANVQEIRGLMNGDTLAPTAQVASDLWSADRLNAFLVEIDDSIATGKFERAVSLSYTCLEGFYKSFVKQKLNEHEKIKSEIIALSKAIQGYIKATVKGYPDEAITMINHISHTVDKARNGFSEAHFAEESQKWLAIYIRDLVNSQIRLLLHFVD